MAQVPPRENHGLVDDPFALCPHRLPLHPCRVSALLRLGTGQQKCDALASVFVGLFVALDLAVTWANYAALLTLSGLYAAVTNEMQRAGYVAAANYASAVLASPTEVFYAIVDLSIGVFIIGFMMLKERGIFKKTTACLGLAAGVFGFISVGRFFIAVMLHTVLITIWFLFVGYRLCRLGFDHSDVNLAVSGAPQAVELNVN